MENASKALLMAAAVLVGVMLLSLGVYLFSIFGNFGSQISGRIEQKQIDEFNSQFYKYQGSETIRIHDIISVANLARQYNLDNDFTNASDYYIKVNISSAHGVSTDGKDLEAISLESKKTALIDKYSLKTDPTTGDMSPQYFKCTSVTINEVSKVVNSITFELIP
ncbi:MAG: hypothetical protein ACI4VQ_01845 [Clostridia bacterium]